MKKIVKVFFSILFFCSFALVITSCDGSSSSKNAFENIKFEDKKVVFDGKEHSIEIEGALPAGVDVVYDNNTHVNAGEYEAIATFKDSTGKYDLPEPMKATLTIEKKSFGNVNFTSKSFVYDGQEHSLEVEGDLPVGVSINYTNNNKIDVGQYEVTATFKDSTGNYKLPEPMKATLSITKKEILDVVFEDKTVVYDGNVHSLAIGTTLPEGVTVEYTNNSKINAGVYEITATFTDTTGNYTIPAPTKATLTINKKVIEGITFESKSVIYDGEEHSLEIIGTLPKGVSVSFINNIQTEVGEYEVTAEFTDTTGNYEVPAPMKATLSVIEYNIDSISFEDKEYTYSGEEFSLEITGTLPRGVIVTYSNNSQTNAGVYEVTATFTDTTGNYVVPAPMKATLTINKKVIEGITLEDLEATYDGEEHSVEIQGKFPEGVTVEYINNSKINAGVYEVTAAFTDTTGNYVVPEELTATLTINKKVIEGIVLEDLEVTYDGEVHTIEIESELPEGVTVEYTNNSNVNVGEYEITATFVDTTGNYVVPTPMIATLTINKKVIEGITLEDLELTYDGKEHNVEIKGELPEGVTVEYIDNVQNEVGVYEVKAVITDTTGNYLVSSELTATLTINKIVLEITFNNAEYPYDGEKHSIYIQEELPEGVAVTYGNNEQIEVGEHEVVATFVDSTGHYEVPEFLMAILKINPLEVTGIEFYGLITGYTGEIYNLEIQGELPEGVEVSYIGNGQKYPGIYEVTAEFTDTTGFYKVPDPMTVKLDILTSLIYVLNDNEITVTGFNNSIKNTIYIPEKIKIDETFYNVTKIADYAFKDLNNIIKIVIADTIVSIGKYTFKGCSYLQDINIPNSVTSIGDRAFKDCTYLSKLFIPLTVTNIGDYILDGCRNLSELTIPTVEELGMYFGYSIGGTSLTGFYNAQSFSHNSVYQYYIPNTLKKVTVLGEEIAAGAFYKCSKIEEIVLPSSLTSIGDSVFRDCTNMKTVSIPENVTSIGDSAFRNCENLETISIPENVSNIGDSAFRGCSLLAKIVIPNVGQTINDEVFRDCVNLSEVIIHDDITTIGNSAFRGCISLEKISLPNNLIIISEYAFYECENLKYIQIPESVNTIDKYAFEYCESLEYIVIDINTTINTDAFRYCKKMSTIYNTNTLTITLGKTGNGYVGYYATSIYNKGEWEYVDGVPTPIIE